MHSHRPNGTEPQQTYEQVRTEEVSIRAVLYRLKLRGQRSELLDRKLLVAELTAMLVAIREIILGSKMAQREKEDLLRQLASIPIVHTSTSVDPPLCFEPGTRLAPLPPISRRV